MQMWHLMSSLLVPLFCLLTILVYTIAISLMFLLHSLVGTVLQPHLVSAESNENNDSKNMQKKCVKIYFKIMFSHLIRLYIAVLVCILLISVHSVPIEPC